MVREDSLGFHPQVGRPDQKPAVSGARRRCDRILAGGKAGPERPAAATGKPAPQPAAAPRSGRGEPSPQIAFIIRRARDVQEAAEFFLKGLPAVVFILMFDVVPDRLPPTPP